MGIIQRQTLKGSFFSYLGVALGFLTVGLLWPRFLEPEEIGLINYLVAVSAILAQVASLGINNVSIRLFPEFRDPKSKHHGYMALGFLFLAAGTVFILIYYLLFRERIVQQNMEKSFLLANYAYFIVPYTIVTLLFNFFEGLHRVIYNAVIGQFVKEFLFRVLNLVLILVYAWVAFRFELFLNLYFVIFSLPPLILIIALARTRQFNLKADLSFISRDMGRSIAGVGFFGLVSGMGTVAVSSIDKIMINHFIDLEATGIYSIAFLFGTIITMPARSLNKIASTILAESWKKNDLENIRMIYTRSSLNQLIFAALIFLLVWLNIDLVFMLIREEYEAGKMVILFMAISGVVQMATGLNGYIVISSKYYRYQALFVLVLLVTVVITNIIFIPMWGITGAAVASLVSTFIYNMSRVAFLHAKFKMHPFSWRSLVVVALLLVALAAGTWLQGIGTWWLRTIFICLAILLLYLLPVLALKISADLNQGLADVLRRVRKH
jgi:O-antigen/teichoic acid export membrane protein